MNTNLAQLSLRLHFLKLILAASDPYHRNELGQFAESRERNAHQRSDHQSRGGLSKEQVEKAVKVAGIVNSDVIKAAAKAGMQAPDPVQDAAYATGKAGVKVARTGLAKQVAKAYSKHQKNLEAFRHLEDAGYTEWVGQMGRMGAAGVEIGLAATEIGALIVLPAAFGGEASLEAMALALQTSLEKRTVTGAVKSLDESVGDRIGANPSEAVAAYVVGATVGGAINDASRKIKEMPKQPPNTGDPETDRQVKELVDEVHAAAEASSKTVSDVREAMLQSGLKEELSKAPPDPDKVAEALRKAYQNMPPDTQEKLASLGTNVAEKLSA